MKKLLVSGLLATFFIVAPAGFADNNANAPSEAKVVKPLSITPIANLYFGGFVNTGIVNNDFIELDDDTTAVTYSVPSHFLPVPSLAPHRATFAITGEPDMEITITKTAVPISIGGGMRVQSLAEHPETNAQLDPSGNLTLFVGGRLKVIDASMVTPGDYSAPFTITVNYE